MLPRPHRRRRHLSALALAGLLSACSAAGAPGAAPDGETGDATTAPGTAAPATQEAVADAGATPATGAASATPTPGPEPTAPVTFAFGGDVHFEGVLDDKVRSDPEGMLSAIAPVLSQADVAVVNLETAVTDGGTPSPKQYNFAAPATAFTALEAAGVDVATLANNHGMDFGTEGLGDTLAAAEDAGFPLVGAGRDDTAAYAPWTTTVEGRRIGVIGVTQVLDSFAVEGWLAGPDTPGLASAKENGIDRLLDSVRETAEEVDTTVVYVHWGREGDSCPLPRQPELAQQLVDAGADIVVGGHAHRLQGGGFLDGAYVDYGLGNFVFYSSSGPATDTGVVLVTVAPDGTQTVEFVPATIRGGVPVPVDGADADGRVAAWDELRSCTDLAAAADEAP